MSTIPLIDCLSQLHIVFAEHVSSVYQRVAYI